MGDMHPVYSAMLEQRRQAGVVDFSKLSPEECRAYARGAIAAAPPAPDLPELAYVGDEMFEAPQGAIRLRRYRPAGAVKGSCMYFHGGGWLLGDLDTSDRTCRRIAGLGGLEVVSVDFRLAPEHPWPSPFEDCYAVTVGVERHSGPLFVAGDSAGGNLAAAVAIRARDEDGPEIAGQIFFYPVTDHDLTTGSYRELGERSLLLTTAAMRYFWDHYCPDPAERANPLVSPLRVASAAGLPP
ncbi:MAG: alpha/beta hydrolase, partial [Rhizorhabdus sp.]